MATIIAEVMMVLIVILMSAIVYIWVVPAFSSQTSQDNAGAAYSEKFETVRAQFATYAVSSPETVTTCDAASSGLGCTAPNPFVTCNGITISSPTVSNVQVPVNGVCVITVSVGAVYVNTGGNLTVIGATINGGLVGNYSSSITLNNANVYGFTGLYNVETVSISGSRLNTSGSTAISGDNGPGAAMYAGGRGYFSMTNSNVTGQVENEVGHVTIFNGDRISGRLEVESADLGQIVNNTVGGLDLDWNGTIVVAGNVVTGTGPGATCPSTGKIVCFGTNAWCGVGNNQISGTTSGACIGNVEVDVRNTGATPVKFLQVYMTNIPLAAGLSWQLASGNPTQCGNAQSLTCSILPIIIPVGDMAEITMGWTAPSGSFPLPWNYIYFIFVSSHQNYVDGYLYFQKGLGMPLQSRLEQRTCPPCY